MSVTEVLARVRSYKGVDDLLAHEGEFHLLVRSILDWAPGERKATKSVVKEFARILSATATVQGVEVPLYARGVAMLSFAAASAPLLDPDRLLRLVQLAGKPGRAYRGIEDPLALSAMLSEVVGKFASERRFELLASLWETANGKEWWEHLRPTKLEDPQWADDDDDDLFEGHGVPVDTSLDGLWQDGKLVLPEAAAQPQWWSEYRLILATGIFTHGRPFFDQVKEAALKVDVMAAAKSAADDGGVFRYGHVMFSSLLLVLHADENSRFWSQLRQAFGTHYRMEEVYENLFRQGTPGMAVLFPFLQSRTTTQMIKRFSLGQLFDHRALSVSEAELVTWLTREVSEDRRGKIVTQIIDNDSDMMFLLQSGLTPEKVFRSYWKKWEDKPWMRKRLLASPYVTPEELLAVVEGDKVDAASLRALGAVMHRISDEKVRSLRATLTPPQRAQILAGSVKQNLMVDLEDDQTVLAYALRELDRDGYSQALAVLSEKVDSWGAAAVVVNHFRQDGVLRDLSPSTIQRILPLADSPSKAAESILETSGLAAETYRAALPYLKGQLAASEVGHLAQTGLLSATELRKVTSTRSREGQTLLALSPFLEPAKRPVDPTAQLVKALVEMDVPEEARDPRPHAWKDLLPKQGLKPYPIPEKVMALHGTMPVEGMEVLLLRSDAELHENARRMGNCTFSYASACQKAKSVLGLITYQGAPYNFSMDRYGQERWSEDSIDSRFNAGNVPWEVRSMFSDMVENLNAPAK